MARLPTAEEAGRHILRIFVEKFQGRPGSVLRHNNFLLPFSEGHWRGSDFKAGMEYAVDNGWIELTDAQGFRLTEAGFAAA